MCLDMASVVGALAVGGTQPVTTPMCSGVCADILPLPSSSTRLCGDCFNSSIAHLYCIVTCIVGLASMLLSSLNNTSTYLSAHHIITLHLPFPKGAVILCIMGVIACIKSRHQGVPCYILHDGTALAHRLLHVHAFCDVYHMPAVTYTTCR